MSAATAALVAEQDADTVGQVALESTTNTLEAEVAAVISSDGSVPISIGFPAGRVPTAEIADVVAKGRKTFSLPGASVPYHAAVVPMSGRRPGHLLVARARDRFDVEERLLLQGAASVLDLTFGASDATFDSLTGLAGRAAFRHKLFQDLAMAPGARMALLYLDLDQFKSVNDTYGHAEGDRLLVWFAERLRSSLRRGDIAARLGGDEFAVLMPEVGAAEATAVAARIVDVLRAPFALADGRTVSVGASIGIALRTDSDMSGGDDFIRRADRAMYRAKTEGTGYAFESSSP
jgi:diguanylate cyclase (GGDEF)-like protein